MPNVVEESATMKFVNNRLLLRETLFHGFMKGIFLIFVLVLSAVPVFQAAHALTHVAPVDMLGPAQIHDNQGEAETDAGLDKICLDCLALTAFSILLFILRIFFFDQMVQKSLRHLKPRRILRNLSFPFLTRAPPQA